METQNTPRPARKGRKGTVVAGVVAAVVVVAAVGLFVWHEQPSFCAALCHTPMDAYYDSYATGETDKYGMEVQEANRASMTAYQHQVQAGTTCMGCHVPTLSEQIGEGLAWVAGDYEVAGDNLKGQAILSTRSLSQLTEARGAEGNDFCMNGDCHDLTQEELEAATADLGPRNPHSFAHGEIACGDCHKAHSRSVNKCGECHGDAALPDGWLAPQAANAMAAGAMAAANSAEA